MLQVNTEELKTALEEDSGFVWDLSLPKKDDGKGSAFNVSIIALHPVENSHHQLVSSTNLAGGPAYA